MLFSKSHKSKQINKRERRRRSFMMKYKEKVVMLLFILWLVCSLSGLYMFGIVSLTDQKSGSMLSFHTEDYDYSLDPGFAALRQWALQVSVNHTISRLTGHFLSEVTMNKSEALDLDKIRQLWLQFKAKHRVAELPLTVDPSRVRTPHSDDFLLWANFIKFMKTSITSIRERTALEQKRKRPAVVENEEYPEPPMRYLSQEVLDKLLMVSREMNKAQLPPRDLGEMLNVHEIPENQSEDVLPPWKRLHNHIRRHKLYSSSDPALDEALHDLRTLPIVGLSTMPKIGTQLKLLFDLQDGSRTLCKPKRMPIHIETAPEIYQFDDFEKFYAEVASFHLDRIMGFNRVPPVISRYINVTKEVKYLAPYELRQTFFRSAVNTPCFYGHCMQFCDTPFAVCGSPELLATSFAFYLPPTAMVQRLSWENPWKFSYYRSKRAEWEDHAAFCEDYILREELFVTTRRLLDIVELGIFDFMQGNMDRHHYHTFEVFGNDTNLFLYDNGRAFARAYRDDVGLLAPVYQCCLMRLSTLDRLLALYMDPIPLSEKMRRSLEKEIVRPILTEKHLRALDRRLVIVLETIYKCILESGGNYEEVIHDDGF